MQRQRFGKPYSTVSPKLALFDALLSSLRSDGGGRETVVFCHYPSSLDLAENPFPPVEQQIEEQRRAGKTHITVELIDGEPSTEERGRQAKNQTEIHVHYCSPERVEKPATGEPMVVMPDPEPSPAATSESPAPAEAFSGPGVAQFKEKPRESVTSYFNRHGWPTWRF